MVMNRIGRVAALAIVAGSLGACQAAHNVIQHSDLQVKTHMSESIFLDPVPEHAKTVFVSARNTSDYPQLDLRGPLLQAIQARGYRIVTDPNKAHFMLRANVLQAGKLDKDAKEKLLMGSYGEPLLAGAGTAALAGALGGAMAGAGLGVAALSFIANEMIQNVTYAITVDIQLSERPLKGQKVQTTTTTSNESGSRSQDNLATMGGSVTHSSNNGRTKSQYVNESKDFKEYNVRTVAYAEQVNLKFEEAIQPLTAKLTSSISNLME
jgi:hypothetical protein